MKINMRLINTEFWKLSDWDQMVIELIRIFQEKRSSISGKINFFVRVYLSTNRTMGFQRGISRGLIQKNKK
jgi:hypothetical protein